MKCQVNNNEQTNFDVIIVGSGISSIGAVTYFSNQHYDKQAKNKPLKWCIFEVSDHVGGRLQSVLIDNRRIDTGAYELASFIPTRKKSCALFQFIQKGLCELNYRQNFNEVYYYNQSGKQISKSDIQKVAHKIDQLADRVKVWVQTQKQLSVQQCYDMFKKEGGINDLTKEQFQIYELMLLMEQHQQGGDADDIAADTFFADGEMEQDLLDAYPLPSIPYHGLHQKIVQELPKNSQIQLNSQVIKIRTQKQLCYVDIKDRVTGQIKTYTSKYVICGAPLSCIQKRSIQFDPPIPQNHQFIIDNLAFGYMQKIILAFETPFWPQNAQRIKITSSKSPNLFPHFSNLSGPKQNNPTQNAHILCCYITARSAIEFLSKHTDKQIINMAVQHLCRVFPDSKIVLKQGIVTRWQDREFINGSFSYMRPKLRFQRAKQIRQPIQDKLWLIGEYCYPQNIGCAHGAFQTGWQAAKSICDLRQSHI